MSVMKYVKRNEPALENKIRKTKTWNKTSCPEADVSDFNLQVQVEY